MISINSRQVFAIISPLLVISFLASGQNTVGVITNPTGSTYSGFNLLYPHNQPDVFLLNNCGEIVHQWQGEADTRPGNTAYILSDGRLIKAYRNADISNDAIWAGGGGASIDMRDWDNNLLWSFTLNDENFRLHHDIEVLEKDDQITILAIAWERKTTADLAAVGRDPALTEGDELWPDYVFEIDPATDEIIWEWHAWDHLVQDRDQSLDNFGMISDHPELIDINYDFDANVDADWMHSNSIDYDHQNRQIILSVPHFHEIWIIDHTTTTQEAAGHSGGLSGRGGDLMFRWGNNAAYGLETEQQLFFQHDANIISDFIDSSDPNYRSIILFNNRVADALSTVNIITPTFTTYDWKYQFGNDGYAPANFSETVTHPVPSRLWSTILSSAQYLPNGNRLITVGRFGYSVELTPENGIVWEYVTPFRGGTAVEQGAILEINQNFTFRMRRYPTTFSAFEGKDVAAKGTIEIDPMVEGCEVVTGINNTDAQFNLIYPNPASDHIVLRTDGDRNGSAVSIVDLNGSLQYHRYAVPVSSNESQIDISDIPSGIYMLHLVADEKARSYRLIVQ